MATDIDFIEFVIEQINGVGHVSHRKMFGEYMIYVNAKPILLVCDNTVFVKMKDELREYLKDAPIGEPYKGAKPHYIFEVEDQNLSKAVIKVLEEITPIPKPKKKKK